MQPGAIGKRNEKLKAEKARFGERAKGQSEKRNEMKKI